MYSLNLSYFLLQAYNYYLGINLNPSQLPVQAIAYFQTVAWAGILVSAACVLMIVYACIRLHEVEHGGWHRLEHSHTHDEHIAIHAGNPQWHQVMALAASPHPSDWRRAIIEADIMLGAMLHDQGYRGASIGDQLKTANPFQFTTLDLAWKAHKIRNDVAHGGESYELTERDFQTALSYYKRVFEEFNYL
jgi:hypothetical protein